MKRLKLVLSLYACEPNRGSEPGVGWAWALGMAKRHDTYVLTRANNKEVIEAELARLRLPESEIPKFIYVDLSAFMCRLKKRGIISVSLYYLLWQFRARSVLDSLHLDADIIHHVTFNSFACPGVWWKRKEIVVLGPLGGMSVCPVSFLRLFGSYKRVHEFIRGLGRQAWWTNVFFLTARRYADAILFTEKVLAERLGGASKKCYVMLETAIPQQLESKDYDEPGVRENQFVWAGSLEPHKACELAIRAYAKAFIGKSDPPILKIIGGGSDFVKYQKIAIDLNVSGTVVFCGKLSQNKLWKEMRRAKALLFTSVRDTSGNVALEALAMQTPVICFSHQGIGEITDATCAIRVSPSGWEQAICGFAEAMEFFGGDDEHANQFGAAGRKRVMHQYRWEKTFDFSDKIYSQFFEKDAQS